MHMENRISECKDGCGFTVPYEIGFENENGCLCYIVNGKCVKCGADHSEENYKR